MRTPKRLPRAHLAIVDEDKIKRYLMSAGHPAGRPKAAFFRHFGFTVEEWTEVKTALLAHARSAQLVSALQPFGTKYVIEGALAASDGRLPLLRAVWFVRTGDVAARLVTAYPVTGADR